MEAKVKIEGWAAIASIGEDCNRIAMKYLKRLQLDCKLGGELQSCVRLQA